MALAALFVASTALAAETRTTDLVSVGPVGGNGPFEAEYEGVAADGSRVFFVTEESLLSADTDEAEDIYQRAGGVLSLISVGPQGGDAELNASYVDSVADGSRVFFTTRESLVPEDGDEAADVYERVGSTTTLISTGPGGGGEPVDVSYAGSSADGGRVFFFTAEDLVKDDEDNSRDLYERAGATTTLISIGPEGGSDAVDVPIFGVRVSTDGSRAFFLTREALVKADKDSAEDLYERFGTTTKLVSIGPDGGSGEISVFGPVISADGSRVFFETFESLLDADGDEQRDAYELHGGVLSLVTTGASGNSGSTASLARISTDGSRTFFATSGSLDPADTDFQADLYERSGGVTSLISIGPVGGNGPHPVGQRSISDDGTRVYFLTSEKLAEDDGDEASDVYERASGLTTLISIGPAAGSGPFEVSLSGNSADGRRVYFGTSEPLLAADGDAYERVDGVTTLISTGPGDAEAGEPVYLADVSADGTHAILNSYESLFAADTDDELDIYASALDPVAPTPTPVGPVPAPVVPIAAPPAGPEKSAPRCFGKPATVVGTNRRDVLRGTNRRDVIVARGGDDRIFGRGGNDLICAGAGRDVVRAGAGKDRVQGNGGKDRIFGQAGNDALFGNGGRDLLAGGPGRDRCRGGAGSDTQRQCER